MMRRLEACLGAIVVATSASLAVTSCSITDTKIDNFGIYHWNYPTLKINTTDQGFTKGIDFDPLNNTFLIKNMAIYNFTDNIDSGYLSRILVQEFSEYNPHDPYNVWNEVLYFNQAYSIDEYKAMFRDTFNAISVTGDAGFNYRMNVFAIVDAVPRELKVINNLVAVTYKMIGFELSCQIARVNKYEFHYIKNTLSVTNTDFKYKTFIYEIKN